MKLLFDQNLSPRLVARLADLFPDSSHVFWAGLDRASDQIVWNFARDNDLTLVTKDVDFSELSTLHGFPPKVIWLRLGNCTTVEVETSLRAHIESIQLLAESQEAGIISLYD